MKLLNLVSVGTVAAAGAAAGGVGVDGVGSVRFGVAPNVPAAAAVHTAQYHHPPRGIEAIHDRAHVATRDNVPSGPAPPSFPPPPPPGAPPLPVERPPRGTPPPPPGRPLGASYSNHQLHIDPMSKLGRAVLANEESKPYADPDSKEQMDAPFEPPKVIVPVDEATQTPNPLDAAEDEAPIEETPVDESTQTVEQPEQPQKPVPLGKPEPKLKPAPLEKPAPGGPLGSPPAKPPPKAKPEPRSLFSLLGLEEPPAPGQGPFGKPPPKGKPAPKGKPMPNPVSAPNGLLFNPFFSSPQSDENTLLHAQMNLLSSPHSEDYSDEAYIAIQSVQDYCSFDYATFCSPMFAMNSQQTPFGSNIVPFGNWEDDDESDGNVIFVSTVMNSIFDIFNNILSGPSDVIVIDLGSESSESGEIQTQKVPCTKQNAQSASQSSPPTDRLLHESHHSHGSEDSSGGSDSSHGFRHHKERHEERHGPERHGPDRHDDPHHAPVASSHASPISQRPNQFVPEETMMVQPSFLGYGQEGDVCLMAYYDSLSAPCRAAVDDAYSLRDQYVQEEEQSHGCPFAAGVAGMLLVLATFLCCKRVAFKGRREKVLTTLKAIHNDPELKARVEAASGVPLPEVSPKDGQPCRGKRCLCFALRLIVTVALSFLLVRFAAGATLAVADSMVYTNEENGETVEPSPVSVLLIFISFLLAELLVVYGVKKCVTGCAARRQNSAFASTGTSSPTVSPQSSGGLGRYLVFPSLPSSTRRFSFFRTTPSGGYSPLMTDEESTVTEMVQSPSLVMASAPLQHQVLYLPPTVNAPPHITAQSLSSVSMI